MAIMLERQDAFKAAGSVAGCLLAGAIGSIFTVPAIPVWYAGLTKPWFTPPDSLFGPVWTTLYIMMGISLFLVWRSGSIHGQRKKATIVFGIQLAVNVLWPVVFFGLRSPGGGVVVIIILWILIAATIYLFSQISKTAALLLVPYILWVSYASALNTAVWLLNK